MLEDLLDSFMYSGLKKHTEQLSFIKGHVVQIKQEKLMVIPCKMPTIKCLNNFQFRSTKYLPQDDEEHLHKNLHAPGERLWSRLCPLLHPVTCQLWE